MEEVTTNVPIVSQPEEAPLRVMALHSLQYCERLFYLEEVEEIRVADAAVYAGRRLHTELEQLESGEEWHTLTLEDESLGLSGKIDCIRRRDGVWIPFEHKRGRSKSKDTRSSNTRNSCDAAELPSDQRESSIVLTSGTTRSSGTLAWPSDRLQAAAYGMLVEAATKETVPEVRVRYHMDGVLVKIPLDQALRDEVKGAIERARSLKKSLQRPPVSSNEKVCERCSLAPVCLPEEERLAQDPSRTTPRLFPEHPDGQSIHITEYGTRISKDGEQLVVVPLEGERRLLPSGKISELVMYGPIQISAQAISWCAHQGIGLHWLTSAGSYIGGFVRGAGQVQRKIRQYEALRDPAVCEALSRRLAQARVESQLKFLMRGTRGEERAPELELHLGAIRQDLSALEGARGLDSIRGYEGDAARHYFAALPAMLDAETPAELIPQGRSRRPPRDRFNAALSFGYSLVHRECLSALLACGLEPSFGFYHQPRSAAHPLALDLMELFRVFLWDMPLIASMNRKQWSLEDDFTVAANQVWLSASGRKKAIKIYEQRCQETWKHPVLGYSLSYRRMVELEARLLEKEWSGSPGLFAKMRLR